MTVAEPKKDATLDPGSKAGDLSKPVDPKWSGPSAIEHALKRLDLGKLEADALGVVKSGKVSKRPRAIHVLNTLEGMKRNGMKPSDLVIHSVPVIPPIFRPFSVMGRTFVPGDANELYRDLMNLRDAHKELEQELGPQGTSDSRLALYDSVRALYGYTDPVDPKTRQRGVSGFLRQITSSNPKFSTVQSKLISKTQDTVARGVIAVDPDLHLDQIGVPASMAWPAYAPYIQRRLVQHGMSPPDALKEVKERTDTAKKALLREMEVRPVVYSRSPAWHKFNIIAGHPKLIDGDTIMVNPLITTGQNADFDGDTMNLHVPSHPDAVKEAYEKLMPSKMLFSIRDQDKVMPVPKHEQVLGLYVSNRRPAKKVHQFRTQQEAVAAIKGGKVPLWDEIQILNK